MQDDLKLHILHIFEGTFLLDMVQMLSADFIVHAKSNDVASLNLWEPFYGKTHLSYLI